MKKPTIKQQRFSKLAKGTADYYAIELDRLVDALGATDVAKVTPGRRGRRLARRPGQALALDRMPPGRNLLPATRQYQGRQDRIPGIAHQKRRATRRHDHAYDSLRAR